MVDLSRHELELSYPCSWSYRVVGRDEGTVRRAIAEVVQTRNHLVEHSNDSASGKYVSLRLTLTVVSADDRTDVFDALRRHHDVKLVL